MHLPSVSSHEPVPQAGQGAAASSDLNAIVPMCHLWLLFNLTSSPKHPITLISQVKRLVMLPATEESKNISLKRKLKCEAPIQDSIC